MVEKYGAQSVYGRTLSANEISRMEYADMMVNIFESRKNSNNWAAWVTEHPLWVDRLNEAEALCRTMK